MFEHPKHPYTKMLIKVIPSLNIKKGEKLQEIPGHVPDLRQAIAGCVFRIAAVTGRRFAIRKSGTRLLTSITSSDVISICKRSDG